MASTSTTLSLSSTSALVDSSRAPRQPTVASSLQCGGLFAPSEVLQNRSVTREAWKATAYCRKSARNVMTMATGDVATGEVVTVDAPVATVETAATSSAASEEAATAETPEILKQAQEAWDKVEDKYAVTSLAAAGLVGLIGVSGLISAIDKLPLVPGVLELVGIGYTGWFAYKNLVFKPNREALIEKIKTTYKEIIS